MHDAGTFMAVANTPIQTDNAANGYLCEEEIPGTWEMIKKIKELYKEYKPYVRVDLIMYGVMILLIILYFIVSLFL